MADVIDPGRAAFEEKWKKMIEEDTREYLNQLRDAVIIVRRNVK